MRTRGFNGTGISLGGVQMAQYETPVRQGTDSGGSIPWKPPVFSDERPFTTMPPDTVASDPYTPTPLGNEISHKKGLVSLMEIHLEKLNKVSEVARDLGLPVISMDLSSQANDLQIEIEDLHEELKELRARKAAKDKKGGAEPSRKPEPTPGTPDFDPENIDAEWRRQHGYSTRRRPASINPPRPAVPSVDTRRPASSSQPTPSQSRTSTPSWQQYANLGPSGGQSIATPGPVAQTTYEGGSSYGGGDTYDPSQGMVASLGAVQVRNIAGIGRSMWS